MQILLKVRDILVLQGQLDELLNAADELSLEDLEALLEILRGRIVKRRRSQIVVATREALQEHAAGQSRPIDVSELMKELLS